MKPTLRRQSCAVPGTRPFSAIAEYTAHLRLHAHVRTRAKVLDTAVMWDLVAGTEGNVSMENVLTTFKLEPQPDFRGTFSILTTCFVTLALCTWKIVHLNLPGTCPDASLPWTSWWKSGTTKSMKHRLIHIFGGHQVARQLGWLVIGLFAPELVRRPLYPFGGLGLLS